MRTTITKRLEWDAAHRVMKHESKCATLHGHRYAAEITVTAERLDRVDRVIDFGEVKRLVGGWIDSHWDHTTMLNAADGKLIALLRTEANERGSVKRLPYIFSAEPTAETIAAELFAISTTLLAPAGIEVVHVRVWETPTACADVERGFIGIEAESIGGSDGTP